MTMRLVNREGHLPFDCSPDAAAHRRPGLAALLRVHNEAAWIGPCLESILPWCDEIVVALNRCTDATPAIVERVRAAHPDRIRAVDYPFAIHPMGPGHDACPEDSVHASSYFYNFTQAQSTRDHVVKWDGDMVAMDWLGPEIRRLMAGGHSRIKFEGTDLVGDDVAHIGCHPRCPTNGVYRVGPGVHYGQGPMTQTLRGATPYPYEIQRRPAFLHFKWCRKDPVAATVQWPENWRDIEHFRAIWQRRVPVAPYEGEYPTPVRKLLQQERAAAS